MNDLQVNKRHRATVYVVATTKADRRRERETCLHYFLLDGRTLCPSACYKYVWSDINIWSNPSPRDRYICI